LIGYTESGNEKVPRALVCIMENVVANLLLSTLKLEAKVAIFRTFEIKNLKIGSLRS